MNHLDTPPVSPADDNPYLAPAAEVETRLLRPTRTT